MGGAYGRHKRKKKTKKEQEKLAEDAQMNFKEMGSFGGLLSCDLRQGRERGSCKQGR
jgi:hypothetical protein